MKSDTETSFAFGFGEGKIDNELRLRWWLRFKL